MNNQEWDILNAISQNQYSNQRIMAEETGCSLGTVNKSINKLKTEGYLNEETGLTRRAEELINARSPKNAIILAAGYGMRMVPINVETPKALLEVNGECLIERLIKQLHEVDVHEIYIVVGFMKERFEYLIDKYHVELVVNMEYSTKNNLHSMKRVLEYLSNSYVIPCDIWCGKNPFRRKELYSWYMVTEIIELDSVVRINRKRELVTVPNKSGGNAMVGISYLTEEDAAYVRDKIRTLCRDSAMDNAFWETALYGEGVEKDRMVVGARVMLSSDVVEINTYEQLREFDENSRQLQTEVISIIAKSLHADTSEITDIEVLKKGMTNRSFLFSSRGKRYIMRIPGEGTGCLINRKEEADVYRMIADQDICDKIAYINSDNGYKITEYLNGARVCDPLDLTDIQKCMKRLRAFHEKNLKVAHEFDIFGKIVFYESLWNGKSSVYEDYRTTKEHVFSLKPFVEKYAGEKVLTHIDAVADNFLFVTDGSGKEDIRLIDWEYAGMQDPHVDVAMFCIYSMYNRQQVERLIDAYFVEGCSNVVRIKIYCYIAMCGLLWSNWCEYKRFLGVEFGEYSIRQYRFAKDYYKIAVEEMRKLGNEQD